MFCFLVKYIVSCSSVLMSSLASFLLFGHNLKSQLVIAIKLVFVDCLQFFS